MAEERDYNLLSATQQVELLRSQGLGFQDEGSAYRVLNNVSLSRLKGYLHPLWLASGDFKVGSTFEQALSLYNFDSALRRVVCSALEEIEISVRTQLARTITNLTNDPFWYMNPSNFRNDEFMNNMMEIFQRELERNDDEFIVGCLGQNGDTMPPIWTIMEVSSFGTTSKLYKNLRSVRHRKTVANYYGISGTIMEIWLHALVSVRNVCAHYNRLWNKNLRIASAIPRHSSLPFLNIIPRTDRIYYVMSIILYFLQTINPQNTFADKVKTLLSEYPHVDVRAMGFPDGWKNEHLWQS